MELFSHLAYSWVAVMGKEVWIAVNACGLRCMQGNGQLKDSFFDSNIQ
jgi:hypothetical protein